MRHFGKSQADQSKVPDNCLGREKIIHAEYCHHPKIFLSIFGGSHSGDWTSYIA